MLIWHKPRGSLCRWVCILVFLRGRYSRSSLMCYKPLVFRSRNGYMLACWICLICSKKGVFFQLFVFPIICIMINSVRVIASSASALHSLARFSCSSSYFKSSRCLLSWSDIASTSCCNARKASLYTMLTDWTAVNLLALGQACRVFELFTSQCVRYRTDHLCQRLAFCVSSARFE